MKRLSTVAAPLFQTALASVVLVCSGLFLGQAVEVLWLEYLVSFWVQALTGCGALVAVAWVYALRFQKPKDRLLLASSIIFLVCVVVCFGMRTSRLALQASDGEPALKVATLNTLYITQNAEEILDFIESEDPDVLVLQEVSLQQINTVQEQNDYQYMVTNSCDDCSPVRFYTGVLSRYPLEKYDASEPYGQIVTGILGLDRPVTLVAIHTTAPSTPTRYDRRNEQLEDLAGIVEGLSGEVIMTGDFNTPSLSASLDDIWRAGLKKAASPIPHATWCSLLVLCAEIDHILISPGLTHAEAQVVPFDTSDHQGFTAELFFQDF